MAFLNIPKGKSEFEKIRREGLYYVDKTVSPRQNRNAECPMLVTESGIVMDCSEST